MKDIAKELGVSIATVSRALKDNPGISKEQWEEIQAYTRGHNFHPNTIAELLCSSKVKPLRVTGAIVPQLSCFCSSSILFGIEGEASARSYRIMMTQSDEKYDREMCICQDYSENKVCGVIVSQVRDTTRCRHFQKLINHGMPLVLHNRTRTGVGCSRVVVDNYMDAFNTITHLIQTGCRRIAYYGTLMIMEISKNRYNGYRDAITKYGLKADDRFFRICDNRASAELIIPELLSREGAPDAFFAMNDDTAVGILYAARHVGYRVSEDISACGFTNGDRAKVCDPMLTTVEQRGVRVDEEATNILIPRMEGFILPDKIEKKIVRTKLVIRGTTK